MRAGPDSGCHLSWLGTVRPWPSIVRLELNSATASADVPQMPCAKHGYGSAYTPCSTQGQPCRLLDSPLDSPQEVTLSVGGHDSRSTSDLLQNTLRSGLTNDAVIDMPRLTWLGLATAAPAAFAAA